MCTSIVLKSKNDLVSLSRTMDFPLRLDGEIIMFPRNYTWNSASNKKDHQTKYAFVGMGKYTNEYIFADGVNEKGLAVACLYFPGYAVYNEECHDTKINLAEYEVVQYLLSNFTTIEEVKEAIPKIHVVNKVFEFLTVAPLLHWIITDLSGKCIVVEPLQEGLKIYDNKVRVMANTPDFNWHLTNLENYVGLSTTKFDDVHIGDYTVKAGLSSGSIGLPGDYTSSSRFVRAVFTKATALPAKNEIELINNAFHVLDNLSITEGNIARGQNNYNYTQYVATMVATTHTYYYKTYENSQISAICLLNEDLNMQEPKNFGAIYTQQINYLNKKTV